MNDDRANENKWVVDQITEIASRAYVTISETLGTYLGIADIHKPRSRWSVLNQIRRKLLEEGFIGEWIPPNSTLVQVLGVTTTEVVEWSVLVKPHLFHTQMSIPYAESANQKMYELLKARNDEKWQKRFQESMVINERECARKNSNT